MEHRLISTPFTSIRAKVFPIQPAGDADLRAEVFLPTRCSISLSSHPWQRLNAVGRLDERKKLWPTKNQAVVFISPRVCDLNRQAHFAGWTRVPT
jgi:hypothetical protein